VEGRTQAGEEQNPVRLMKLVEEINDLLKEKETRLNENRARNDYKETDST